MISLLQRVSEARVVIAGETVGEIGHGLLVLVCAGPDDTEAIGEKLLAKILKLRIFSDEAVAGPPQGGLASPPGGSEPSAALSVGAKSSGKMNRSVQDVAGGLLIVSQFTLAADTQGGNRPGFSKAAPPALGEVLYDRFVEAARRQHPVVQTGRFGADMQVHLINDGPVTIPLRMG